MTLTTSDDDLEEIGWAFDPDSGPWQAIGVRSQAEMNAWASLAGTSTPLSFAEHARSRLGRAARTGQDIAPLLRSVDLWVRSGKSLDVAFDYIRDLHVCTPTEWGGVLGSRALDSLAKAWGPHLPDDLTCTDLLWSAEAYPLLFPRRSAGMMWRPVTTSSTPPKGVSHPHTMFMYLMSDVVEPRSRAAWALDRIGFRLHERATVETLLDGGEVTSAVIRQVTFRHSSWTYRPEGIYDPVIAVRAALAGWYPLICPAGKPARAVRDLWPGGNATITVWGWKRRDSGYSTLPRSGVWAAPHEGVSPWKIGVIAARIHRDRQTTWADAYREVIGLVDRGTFPEVPSGLRDTA